MQSLGKLILLPIKEHLNLVAEPTANFLIEHSPNLFDDMGVAEIDPAFSDTAKFCEHYEIILDNIVNCVIIKATRLDKITYVACLVFGNTKVDVNGLVRRHLEARKASFAPMEEAVALTKMEYGGITAIGLPKDWLILVDSNVVQVDELVIGSGIRKSKLLTSGKILESLPNAVVLQNLGIPR